MTYYFTIPKEQLEEDRRIKKLQGKRRYNHSKKGIACKKRWDKKHPNYYRNWRKANPDYNKNYLERLIKRTQQKMIEEFKEMIDKKIISFEAEKQCVESSDYIACLNVICIELEELKQQVGK